MFIFMFLNKFHCNFIEGWHHLGDMKWQQMEMQRFHTVHVKYYQLYVTAEVKFFMNSLLCNVVTVYFMLPTVQGLKCEIKTLGSLSFLQLKQWSNDFKYVDLGLKSCTFFFLIMGC